MEKMTKDEREAILSRFVHDVVASEAWRIESQISTSATLVKGKQTSHLLHFILSCLTFGFWILAWLFCVYRNRRQVLLISVDEYGQILRTKQTQF